MEMFIDAYPWVMWGNIVNMGQFAEGGLATTRPYFSSSKYLLKMSNYTNEDGWVEKWDKLYTSFLKSQYHKLKNLYIVGVWARAKNEK